MVALNLSRSECCGKKKELKNTGSPLKRKGRKGLL